MKFYFGYDIDNVLQVQDYVELNFSEDEFEMEKGYGDDCMNYLQLNVERKDEVRVNELLDLIEGCDGEGKFEE